MAVAPKGLKPFTQVLPNWLQDKLWLPPQIESALKDLQVSSVGDMYFAQHHESHAASAFYPSPFNEAAVLTIDGVGEWATASIGYGSGSSLELLQEMHFPHSLGLLYSAFTYFCGFKVNSDEYKLMGLAPYGEDKYSKIIKNKLLDLKKDGSFRLNMKYFSFLDEMVMVNEAFWSLFGGPPRNASLPITKRERDIARSIQAVTEEIVLLMARHAKELTSSKSLCLAGGVALNCVANGRLLKEKIFDNLWIQPASDDAGGALGAALTVYHNELKQPRKVRSENPVTASDDMRGAFLGPVFSDEQIKEYLDAQAAKYVVLDNSNRAKVIAHLIDGGNIIGLFDGRMEFGPRALGNRSIIADPRKATMQSILNLKIKFRESFRPFAAAVLEEKISDFFEIEGKSSYMLLVAQIRESLRCNSKSEIETNDLAKLLAAPRSQLPAITHMDNSCRLQSVNQRENPRFYEIIKAFESISGFGAVINTSFNIKDEPIVCTPTDAWHCFMRTEMDVLVIGSYLLKKSEQNAVKIDQDWENILEAG